MSFAFTDETRTLMYLTNRIRAGSRGYYYLTTRSSRHSALPQPRNTVNGQSPVIGLSFGYFTSYVNFTFFDSDA